MTKVEAIKELKRLKELAEDYHARAFQAYCEDDLSEERACNNANFKVYEKIERLKEEHGI